MSFSLVLLSILVVALICGAGQRILDKLRMSDRWAIIVLIAIIIGMIAPPVRIGKYFAFSIGGFLIPFGVCVYLLIRSGWSMDLLRAILGSLATAIFILAIEFLLPSDTPQDVVIDNTWLYGLVAGVVAYVLGRSRRNAVVCSVFGITLASLAIFLVNLAKGQLSPLKLGLGGAMDTIVLSIIISVVLCEIVGKTAESVVGKDEGKVFDFESGEFVSNEENHSSGSKKLIKNNKIGAKEENYEKNN